MLRASIATTSASRSPGALPSKEWFLSGTCSGGTGIPVHLVGAGGQRNRDHFNRIAVLSLTLHVAGTGAAVGSVMIARTLSAIIAAPIAGVALDRLDRKRVMIASDVMRAIVAGLFILVLTHRQLWAVSA